MNIKRIVLSLVILVIFACIALFTVFYNRSKVYKNASNEALARIANQLGVEQNWEIVRQDIYCRIVIEGMTLEEIEEHLTYIADVEVSQNDIEGYEYFIHFTEPYVEIYDLFLLFNENHLLNERKLSVSFGDIIEVNCP